MTPQGTVGAVEPAVIGLLGGMSWPSTTTYYQAINQAIGGHLGGSHSARVLIWSDDYARVERMQLAGDWRAAGEFLASGAARLEAAGADMLAIACNTMHRVADAVRSATALPLIDLVEVCAAEVQRRGVVRAAVLGTRFTAEMGRYSRQLAALNVEPVFPRARDQRMLDRLIYDELCVGIVSDRARVEFRGLTHRLAATGCDAVILACTELGLLLSADPDPDPNAIPLIDTTRIHVDALVDASLAGVPAGPGQLDLS